MKNIFLLLLITLFNISYSYAQEKGKFRFDIDIGYASLNKGDDGGGFVYYFEPKYTITKNTNIGIRCGGAFLAKATENIINGSNGRLALVDIGINSSVLGTFDYYFNKGKSSFAPFIGAGAGIAFVSNTKIDFEIFDLDEEDDNTDEEFEGEFVFGGMLRAGFEWSKFRLSLDYNITPDTVLKNLEGQQVGTSKNSYLGITLGFYLGGGKWKTNS